MSGLAWSTRRSSMLRVLYLHYRLPRLLHALAAAYGANEEPPRNQGIGRHTQRMIKIPQSRIAMAFPT